MLRQVQNPLGMLQQLAGNNPLIGRALAMGNGKSADELQVIVRNLAQQRGMNEEQLNQFLSGFGLRL
jgi:hypothetical protein